METTWKAGLEDVIAARSATSSRRIPGVRRRDVPLWLPAACAASRCARKNSPNLLAATPPC